MGPALAGKRALIYGGATAIGYASALAMLENGAKVFITGRRKERLKQAGKALSEYGAVGFAAGDFTREVDVARVTKAALAFLGGIDTLVVSSGRSGIGSILDCSLAQFQEILTVNLVGLSGKVFWNSISDLGRLDIGGASTTADHAPNLRTRHATYCRSLGQRDKPWPSPPAPGCHSPGRSARAVVRRPPTDQDGRGSQ